MTRLVIWSLAAGMIAEAAAGGGIAGRVTDGSGAAVSGAGVMASLQPPSAAGPFTPFTATAASGADGSFTMAGLPAGTYRLCAEHRAAGMLNPCLWSDEPILAAVAEGQTTQGRDIRMAKGAVLTVRLNDPRGLLSRYLGKTPGAHILVGIGRGTAPFMAATPSAADDTGRELTLLVPVDTPLQASVFSSFFSLADETGARAKKGLKIPVTVASGGGGKRIVVQGMGAAAP